MNFVLVHGAWHGGWCWKAVSPLLRAAGHDAYVPTLTGLGERKHLGGPAVGLETHVEDVLNLLVYEDLRDVVLVGHSYAGMVVRGVADRAPERLRHAVYLDAHVPEDGQSLQDLRGGGRLEGEGWALPAPTCVLFDVKDPAQIRWVDARLTPHPRKTFLDRIALRDPVARRVPASFIQCTRQEDGFDATAARCRARGWPVYEIAAGHDCMLTAPAELAGLLLAIAGRAA